MELDIAEGKIGELGSYDVELKGGKLIAKIQAAGPGGALTGEMFVAIDGKVLFAKIKEAIPGQVDDAILSVLEAALLGA